MWQFCLASTLQAADVLSDSSLFSADRWAVPALRQRAVCFETQSWLGNLTRQRADLVLACSCSTGCPVSKTSLAIFKTPKSLKTKLKLKVEPGNLWHFGSWGKLPTKVPPNVQLRLLSVPVIECKGNIFKKCLKIFLERNNVRQWWITIVHDISITKSS